MGRKPDKNKINFIKKGLRTPVLVWCIMVGALMLFGISFAWFTKVERTADSKTVGVMEPYYLTLLNPSETDVLQLSIGNLMPGRTKQVLFCVSNKSNEENDAMNMGGADFDYSMELVHTENLALNYTLYELEKVAPEDVDGDEIVAEDITITDGETTTTLTYWSKGQAFDTENEDWTDVSEERHREVELTGTEINRGTYISYASDDFHLKDDESGYDSQYFLLEIEWQEDAVSNFEKYDKETDMIYVLVKALLPKPE